MGSFGLSTTYRVVWIPAGPRLLSAAEAGRRLFGPVMSAGRASSLLLGNGGRLRLDVAGQPEYATPDCGSPLDLVVHDKAGERILEGLAVDAGRSGCAPTASPATSPWSRPAARSIT